MRAASLFSSASSSYTYSYRHVQTFFSPGHYELVIYCRDHRQDFLAAFGWAAVKLGGLGAANLFQTSAASLADLDTTFTVTAPTFADLVAATQWLAARGYEVDTLS